MVSKAFDKSRKISSIFCFELKKEFFLLVYSVHAWLVECDFLKPNWQFDRIFYLFIYFTSKTSKICSAANEI